MNDPRSDYWLRILEHTAEGKPTPDELDLTDATVRDGQGANDDVGLLPFRDKSRWLFVRHTKPKGPTQAATEACVVGTRDACLAAMTDDEKRRLSIVKGRD
jgi:hypothetical protein